MRVAPIVGWGRVLMDEAAVNIIGEIGWSHPNIETRNSWRRMKRSSSAFKVGWRAHNLGWHAALRMLCTTKALAETSRHPPRTRRCTTGLSALSLEMH